MKALRSSLAPSLPLVTHPAGPSAWLLTHVFSTSSPPGRKREAGSPAQLTCFLLTSLPQVCPVSGFSPLGKRLHQRREGWCFHVIPDQLVIWIPDNYSWPEVVWAVALLTAHLHPDLTQVLHNVPSNFSPPLLQCFSCSPVPRPPWTPLGSTSEHPAPSFESQVGRGGLNSVHLPPM